MPLTVTLVPPRTTDNGALEAVTVVVAMNTTGGKPGMVAVTDAVPALLPRVTRVEAIPWASVVAMAGFTVAFAAVNVTVTPDAALPRPSFTSTEIGFARPVEAAPDWLFPEATPNEAATPKMRSILATKPSAPLALDVFREPGVTGKLVEFVTPAT